MKSIYQQFYSKKGQLAVLIDPDKVLNLNVLDETIKVILKSNVDFLFIGGSTGTKTQTEEVIEILRKRISLPILLFPGDPSQVTELADGMLYLSLTSGRNSDFLIGKQVESANQIWELKIEKIPTGYILIDGGKETMVQIVSKTKALSRTNFDQIHATIKASVLLGLTTIYLDAGSGAEKTIPLEIVSEIRMYFSGVLIVGGGIRTVKQFEAFKNSDVNIIVVGNKVEENPNFLAEISQISRKN